MRVFKEKVCIKRRIWKLVDPYPGGALEYENDVHVPISENKSREHRPIRFH